MKNLEIDIETFSSVDLSKCGVYKYAESPDFEILLFGYSVSDSKLRETQKANYFSNLCSVDCAVLSVKGQSCRKYCAVLP